VPGVTAVRLAAADPPPSETSDLAEAARAILDADVNPAIAAHAAGSPWPAPPAAGSGSASRAAAKGCSLAEVTLRQGIEPLLRPACRR